MSSTLDRRILEMRFDNRQFESGIQTSLKSLGQLEKGLQLKGAADSLNEINKAAKSLSVGNVSFTKLSDSLDLIASKFTGLGILGVTAMRRIADSILDTGKKMVSVITIDPIKTGFKEYETQMNAIQTILANTQKEGKTLTDVTAALDELNLYADKTIYNFTEMTRNIGTFTAAGVKLDTAVNAIQGIANLAAISGSTSQQASTAMYQLSQAMASGTVKLMDWNSVVNAGMGGQVFQDALKETARAHGIAVDAIIEKQGSFRESLSEGWITTDILTETLEKFTATTEGLTEEQIKANREMWKARGYTDAQIDAIFEMGKTATDAATKVKTFTQLFDTLKEAAQSGWAQSWEIIVGDFEEAKELLTGISNEIGGIITTSAEYRNNLLQGWKDAGGRDDVIEGLKALYGLLKAIVEPARQAFEEIFPAVSAEQLKSYTQKFEDFAKQLKVSPAMADKLKRSFKGFFAVVDIGGQILSTLASAFAKVIGYTLPIGSNLLDMTASFGDFLVELSNATRASGIFGATMDVVGSGLKLVINLLKKLTSIGAGAFKFFEEIDLSGAAIKMEPMKAIAEAGAWALEKLRVAYENALPFLSTAGNYFAKAFSSISTAVSTAVSDGTLTKLAEGGVFAALIVGINKATKAFEGFGKSAKGILNNAGGIFKNISGVLKGVTEALEGMQNKLKAEALKNIATAIAILAGSLMVLSLVNQANLGNSLGAITAMFVELMGALTILVNITDGAKVIKMMGAVSAMKGIATAILVLAAAMAVMSNMDPGGIARSLLAIIALMGTLTIVVQKLGDGSVQMLKGTSSLIAFALAIGILAASVKTLGSMNVDSLIAGLAGLLLTLTMLGAFLTLTNIGSVGISAGIGLMAIASAVFILSSAIRNLGSMDVETIGRGLSALALALASIVIAANLLPKNLISAGAGLMGIAASLLIIGAALHIMGSLSFDEMAIGLSAMGLALTELVVAANAMKGSIAGAAAILIMSAAMVVLSSALTKLGELTVGKALIALGTLAGTLAILGGAAALLTPLIPIMATFAATLLTFGIAATVVGIAINTLAGGIAAVATGVATIIVAMVAAITSVVGAIPVWAEAIGATVVAIADAISAAVPAVGGAITSVIQTILDILVSGINSISDAVGAAGPAIRKLAGLLTLLGVASTILAPLAPAIITVSAALTAFGIGCTAIAAGVTVLAGALALLGASGMKVASSLTDIYTIINTMGDMASDAVASNARAFKNAGKDAAEAVVSGLKEGLSKSGTAFSSSLTSSLQNGIASAGSGITAALQSVVTNGNAALTGSYPVFQSTGFNITSRLAAGVTSNSGAATRAVTAISSGMQSALSGCKAAFYSIGSDIVQGLANGIKENRYLAISESRTMATLVKNAAKAAVDVNSPSKDFEDIGMWIDMGLANGLMKFSHLATNAATQLGQSTIQPVMSMTNDMLNDLGSMGSALRGTASLASALDSTITNEQHVTVNHTFEDLTVKGVNDQNEFVAVANYSVEEMLTGLMRKGIRL